MTDFETARCSMLGIVVRNRDDGTEYPFTLIEAPDGAAVLAPSQSATNSSDPLLRGRYEGEALEALIYAKAQMRAAGFMT